MSMNYSEIGESYNPFIYDDVDGFTIDIRDFYDEYTVTDEEEYQEQATDDTGQAWSDWATH